VKAAEVVVLARDALAASGTSVEDFPIDPFGRIDTSLDGWNATVKGDAEVGASLEMAPLIEIGY
jgi:hypothetical protein